MLLFYPASPSLRMEHVVSPPAVPSLGSPRPLQPPREEFPPLWVNQSPFFFINCSWQQHRGILSFYQAGKQRRSPRPVRGTYSRGGDASSFVSVNGLWLLQQRMFVSRSWVLGLAFCWVLFSLFS